MNKENKTMIIKNIGKQTEKMHYPIPYQFPPDEPVEVTVSIGKNLIAKHNFVEVKGKERTPDPNKAVDKKKGKVK